MSEAVAIFWGFLALACGAMIILALIDNSKARKEWIVAARDLQAQLDEYKATLAEWSEALDRRMKAIDELEKYR